VEIFSLNLAGKTLTLTANGISVDISLIKDDPSYLSRFLTCEVKKEFTTSIAGDFPLASADDYSLNAINGHKGILGRDAADAKKMKATSTYTKPPSPLTYSVTAASVMNNTSEELIFKISTGDVTLTGVATKDFDKLAMGQTSVRAVSGLAAGFYLISDSFANNQYYLQVTGTTGVLMVIHHEHNLAIRMLKKFKRVLMFVGFYALSILAFTLAVKNLDSEIYILGGGISGAVFGFDGTEDTVLEDSVMNVSDGGGSEDLSGGPGRTDRPRSSSPDVTSSPTTSRTEETVYGENETSYESQEKADAHSASCVLLVTTIAFFLL